MKTNLLQSRALASDNFSGVHPEVMAALQKANAGHAIAYGADPWTDECTEVFKRHFGPTAEVYAMTNGTSANVCTFKSLLRSWQAVLCADTAHIWTDECGAVPANSGCSLLPVPGKQGKLPIESLHSLLHFQGVEHHVQPAALSITQSTEMGTLYTIEELRKIGQFAKKHQLLFHMDGARISNAAAALGVSFREMTTEVGVDVLSFGGTKNGLMGAEAVVFLTPGLGENFKFVRKQSLQLASKMRFLSAQLIALLEGDLWLRNARHSNAMAKLLEEKLRKNFPQMKILYPVEVNALFVQLPASIYKKVQEKFFFWIWDEENSVVRWMTTWDTEPEFIDLFVENLKHELR
ncbi:MAG: low specificity L-threonine aldolase [Verrucomicrobia bacterium]|nr:low specificity L-threonine aldolase [Verrucomicrobiota bacterium]